MLWGDAMKKLLKLLIFLLLLALAAKMTFSALSRVHGAKGEEDLQNLTQALRRGAVACYAQEGFYPPDIDFLLEYSGITWDRNRYWIHYEIFASNLMPDITVIEKSYEK